MIHNRRHHIYTNIVGEDTDLRFSTIRLSEGVAYEEANRYQVLTTVFIGLPFFNHHMNFQFTGMYDVVWNAGTKKQRLDHLSDFSWTTINFAAQRFLRKAVPYEIHQLVINPL